MSSGGAGERDIRLTPAWVAGVTAGTIVRGKPADLEFSGVSIDTRTIQPGELFVAIRGDRFDGADFVNEAIGRGATGVIVPSGWTARHRTPADSDAGEVGIRRTVIPVLIEVEDTIRALQALARAVRRASGTSVVAITGSAGKTTTKDVTSELLSARYRVIRNKGNLNNHIGLPLSLLELRRRPQIAVVELGMNHAGEIRALVDIAEPEVRVWTNVGDAHIGFFDSVDAIADAKGEILEHASRSTVLVANADDGRVMGRVRSFPGRLVTFGIDREADVRAEHVADRGIEGVTAHVTTSRGDAEIACPLIGRSNLANVLAAIAVALNFDVPLMTAVERVARLSPSTHRGEVLRLATGVTLVDDSYNANPTATIAALQVLARSRSARRVAILGEMLELGDHSVALHQDVGRAAAATPVDVLLAVGGRPAAALAEAAREAGIPSERVRHFATSEEAAKAAAELVRTGDLVLVKGSRGVRTDRVVDRLKAEAA